MRISSPAAEKRRALSSRIRPTRATAPGSPAAQTGPVGGTTVSLTARSRARSANSAATARVSSPSSTGSRRSSTPASRRLRSSSSEARLDRRRSSNCAPRSCVRASSTSSWPRSRSSVSSSRLPCSEVSGVRSSCDAVATNARRASSWRRSACCIEASARARSPTSSRPGCTGGTGALTPSRASASALRRRRPRRRDRPVDSTMPSSSATPSPNTAAVRNAERTTSTALPPGSDLRTTRTRKARALSTLLLAIFADCGLMATATPLPSFDALSCVWPVTTTLRRSASLGSVIPPLGYRLVGVASKSPTRASVRCASVLSVSVTSSVTTPSLRASWVSSCSRVASAAPLTASRLGLSSLSCSGESSASAATTSVTTLVASNANNKRVRSVTRSPVPEAVARAADREDQLGRLRLLFELLAQVADVHVDGARVAVGAVAPDRAQQLLAVVQPPRLVHQALQQLELGERQPHGLGGDRHPALALVEHHVGDLQQPVVEQVAVGAAQDRADARPQLGEAERLGDVVVGAGLQALDGVGLGVQRGQHDHRRDVAPGAQRAGDVVARRARAERDVEQDDVEVAAARLLQRVVAVGDRRDAVTLPLEGAGEHVAEGVVVVDDEDVERRPGGHRLFP